MNQREKLLRAALRRSIVALDDWLHFYANDMVDAKRLTEGIKRIGNEGGTLAYIASVQARNRKALKAK